MKKVINLFPLILLWHVAPAQISFTPYVGMNATKIYTGILYENGGASALVGADLELAGNRGQHRSIYLAIATGATYMRNGFYHAVDFSFPALNSYSHKTTDLRTENIQFPFTLRLHWQPFPLVEDWQIFLGAGACYAMLIKSTLQETYTEVNMNGDFLAAPIVTSYADGRDVTGYGEKNSIYGRIEFGMRYKRLQLCYRLSKSLTDLYRTGLEKDWNIPDDDSWYINTHQDAGKITEKHSELVVGFRLGGGR